MSVTRMGRPDLPQDAVRILEHLSLEASTDPVGLAEALSLSPVEADQCCFTLARRNLVVSDGAGVYRLTDRGAAYVAESAPVER